MSDSQTHTGQGRGGLVFRPTQHLRALLISVLRLPVDLLVGALRLLSALCPRDPALWVITSQDGRSFSNNGKYLFLHLVQNCPQIRPVWITRSGSVHAMLREAGLPCRRIFSVGGLRTLLRAGVYVSDHQLYNPCHWLCGRALRVNLWHGVGLKQIGYTITDPARYVTYQHNHPSWWFRLQRKLIGILQPPHILTTTSEFCVDHFVRSFRLPPSRVLVTGYPRNDALGRDIAGQELGIDREAEQAMRECKGRTVLYAPTFREGHDESAEFWNPGTLRQLDAALAETGLKLWIKPHPADRTWQIDLSSCPCIALIDPVSDVYPLLRHAGLLISDYSSICYDYMLLDRPIIYAPYDREAYAALSRQFVLPYEENSPGDQVFSMDELIAALPSNLSDDPHRAWRREVRDRFFDHTDFKSCGRVIDAIRDRAGSV
jgi:CDP-glycerol glycerophosphotransferase (TagB/SpsB family)